MDSTTSLENIALGQQNCKVYGRLLRLWDAINMKSKFPDSLISIDGILLDEHGTMAQIIVPKRFQKQFRYLLTEGNVYIFADVAVVDINIKTHIYHYQKYMLQFKHGTKVHRLENRGANIPKFSFKFCPFDELAQKNINAKPLQDIIGVITDVGPFDYASPTSPNKLRIIKIRNLDEETQEIRLWGQHGETFDEETVLENSKEGIVVGIFAGVTAVEFSGIVHASSTSATKIYINLDTDEVKNYQTSYKWKTPPLQQQLPQVVRLTPIQAAGKLYTLDKISNMPTSSIQDGATYSTIAKVESIISSAKWYYKGCKHCDKGYNTISDTPKCLCTNSYPKPMYKLPITLIDDSGNLEAIAFSNVAEQLVELNAYQASQNMKIDPEEHVATLDKAIGKTRLFHIAIKADSSSRFPVSYVIKRSFSVENVPSTKTSPDKEAITNPTSSTNIQSPVTHNPAESENTTASFHEPTTTNTENNNIKNTQVKRSIQFQDEDTSSKDNSLEQSGKKVKKS